MDSCYRLRRISGRTTWELWDSPCRGAPGCWLVLSEAFLKDGDWFVLSPISGGTPRMVASREDAEKALAGTDWTGRINRYPVVESAVRMPSGIRFHRRSVLRAASLAEVYAHGAYDYEIGEPTAASWEAAIRVRSLARRAERPRFSVRSRWDP